MSVVAAVPRLGLASITDAAAFLAVSRGKLYQMIHAGECPSKRFGRSVRIPWQWLHDQASMSEQEA
jgi:excisionase family DNA binding protein